jgi:hypothetical protein
MRVALEKKYGKSFVVGKKDDQIIAVYKRLQSQNKI